MPGSQSDAHGLPKLPLHVSEGSTIWADAGYTDYKIEDLMAEQEGIALRVKRKSNSKRKDEPWMNYLKEQTRKIIETHFSCIKAKMPRSVHAVTGAGFLLKTALFIIAYAFDLLIP